MSSDRFYADLPVITDFDAVTRTGSYTPLPDDWHLALCDVANSTIAVQEGKYKSVNTLGAAAIYGVGGHLVISGTIESGTLVALAAYITRVYQPLTGLTA